MCRRRRSCRSVVAVVADAETNRFVVVAAGSDAGGTGAGVGVAGAAAALVWRGWCWF